MKKSKNKTKKNRKVKNSNQRSTGTSNVKLISFELLDKLSNENYGRYNQNVWTEKILEKFPMLRESKVILKKVLDHHDFMGNSTEHHYRCIVYIQNHSEFLLQDVSIEQWNSIPG
jgi:hypothetical protein